MSCFGWETPFLGKIVSKDLKLSAWDESWYLDLFQYAEFGGNVHLSCFGLEMHLLDKFGQEKQNCLFKMKPNGSLVIVLSGSLE